MQINTFQPQKQRGHKDPDAYLLDSGWANDTKAPVCPLESSLVYRRLLV